MSFAIYTDQCKYLIRVHLTHDDNVIFWNDAPGLYSSTDDNAADAISRLLDEEPCIELKGDQLYIDDEAMVMLKIKYGKTS